jgi:hypothetical protein
MKFCTQTLSGSGRQDASLCHLSPQDDQAVLSRNSTKLLSMFVADHVCGMTENLHVLPYHT